MQVLDLMQQCAAAEGDDSGKPTHSVVIADCGGARDLRMRTRAAMVHGVCLSPHELTETDARVCVAPLARHGRVACSVRSQRA